MRLRAFALLAATIFALAGCGSSATRESRSLRHATLILDFTPNAVHTGIYSALARSYDVDAGVRLHVIAPAASTDAIQLL
jgi:putative hydroxymethylpyrimidine transport system substrate-binding protein